MSQRIRAKFRIGAINKQEYGTNVTLHANAVYGTEGENADFSKATPWGILQMNVDADLPAATMFKPGEEVYLYLEKIEG